MGKIPWRTDRLPTPVFLGFPGGSAGKESACNAGDLGSIPGLGRSPAEGKGYPLQYSGLENSMDCTVHGVAKSWTRLSNFFTLTFILQRVYLQAHGVILRNSHCLGSVSILAQYEEERSLSLFIINMTVLGELRACAHRAERPYLDQLSQKGRLHMGLRGSRCPSTTCRSGAWWRPPTHLGVQTLPPFGALTGLLATAFASTTARLQRSGPIPACAPFHMYVMGDLRAGSRSTCRNV